MMGMKGAERGSERAAERRRTLETDTRSGKKGGGILEGVPWDMLTRPAEPQ